MSSERRRRGSAQGCLFTSGIALFGLLLTVGASHAESSWKTVAEMSVEDKARFDASATTPRDGEIPYLPAERYPFEAPYTAEEMGYRSAEFPHVSRWPGTILDVFGVVTSSGYINQGETIFYLAQENGPGFAAYMYDTKPGEVYSRWITYDTFPPENEATQQLWLPRRTNMEFRTKMDFFVYSPQLRRVRRQPEPRRDQRFPDNAQTFDDVIGRDPWEFEWQLLGTDVLYETVRFPNTRSEITLNLRNEGFVTRDPKSLKPMGDKFPNYQADGGVACWVVKATVRPDWLPGYSEKTLILWLEKDSFYPLRQEKYDPEGKLMTIEVRLADLERPDLGTFGYSALQSIYWNVENDLISYSFHNPHRPHDWTDDEKAMIFTAEFMRRDWLVDPMKSQVLIDDPDEYYMRPHIDPEKFPSERNMTLPPAVAARVESQNAAGRLIFETAPADATTAGN